MNLFDMRSKHLLPIVLMTSYCLAQSGGLLNGTRGIPYPNSATGTTLWGTATISTAGTATTAAANATGPVRIVVGGAGTSGNATLASSGTLAPCTMDAAVSSAGNFYVIAGAAGQCHPQSAAPAAGTWVIGYLHDATTTLGGQSLVHVNGFFYGGSGGGGGAISALTAATAANTIANGDFSQTWQWSLTSANNSGLDITESTASTATTGTSSLLKIAALSASTAIPLTIQAPNSANPAIQVLNSTGTVTTTISPNGVIATNQSFQSLGATSGVLFCGGQCTGNVNTAAGGGRFKGSDTSNTSQAAASGGYAILNAGGLTATTPLAGAVNSVTELASPYLCTGTCTLGTVMCATGSLDQITACATTPQSVILGVSEGSSGATAWVVSSGSAQVNVDNTAVLGHTLCTSTTTAGSATDSGGTATCATGQQIGVVMAVTGTTVIPSGTSAVTATFSTSAPKVALRLR